MLQQRAPGNAVLHEHAKAQLHGRRWATFWDPQLGVAENAENRYGRYKKELSTRVLRLVACGGKFSSQQGSARPVDQATESQIQGKPSAWRVPSWSTEYVPAGKLTKKPDAVSCRLPTAVECGV